MDRYSAVQLNHQHYVASVLNSRQRQFEKDTKRNAETEKEIVSDAGSSVTYEPPPSFSSHASTSSSKEGSVNSKKSFRRSSRTGFGRTKSEGYIPPNPLRTNTGKLKETNTNHSITKNGKSCSKSFSQRGILRAHSNIYIHSSKAVNKRMNTKAARTNRMITSLAMTDKTASFESTSSSTSVRSIPSSASVSSCPTGTNLYNSISKIPTDATIMSDDPSIVRNRVTTARHRYGDENDYNVSLSSLPSSSLPKLSYTFRRLLSNISDDSLVIMEKSEEFDEDDLLKSDKLRKNSLFNSEEFKLRRNSLFNSEEFKNDARTNIKDGGTPKKRKSGNNIKSIGTIINSLDISLRGRNKSHRRHSNPHRY